MKRRLFNHARSFEVDPAAGRFIVRPLRAWYLCAALASACVAATPWLITRLGSYDLATGGWMMVLIYGATAVALGALGLSPRNRHLRLDLGEQMLDVGAPFWLGRTRSLHLGELRFGYRERLLPVGDVVACSATVAHSSIGELVILQTTREHKRLPKRMAHALEQTRRDGHGAHLGSLADELAAAAGLGWGGGGIIAALFALGPIWLWWYLA